MKFLPGGVATGIGSLPFTDPDDAIRLIRENMPVVPHWPQLPRRGGSEGFVDQFLHPLVKTGLLVREGDRTYFPVSASDWPDRLTEFYSVYLAAEEGDRDALSYFSTPRESAVGFYSFIEALRRDGTGEARYLKGHLAGPLTVGFQLKDDRGRLSYYEDQLRDLLVKTLAMQARWQTATLGEFGLPVIIFVDEPRVSVCGNSNYITVTREMIIRDLNTIFKSVHAEGGLAGVHSCDAVDWSILYESELEIVNLDAYQFGGSLLPFAGELKEYLRRGGVMAWGIVPTSDRAFTEDGHSLLEMLERIWAELEERGVDGRLLRDQCLITPACGTGLLEPDLARRIYGLTRKVSELVMARAG